jgi:hypothetical protein
MDNDGYRVCQRLQQHNGSICGNFYHPYLLRIQRQSTNRSLFGVEPQKFYNVDRQKGNDKLGYHCSLFRFRELCKSLLILEVIMSERHINGKVNLLVKESYLL